MLRYQATRTGPGWPSRWLLIIRFVAPNAQLAEAYIRIGRYSGGGDTVMLPRLIGTSQALRLFWTGDAVSGEEALAIGLADELADDPLDAAMALAGTLTTKNPTALALTKRAVYDTAALPFADALQRSIEIALAATQHRAARVMSLSGSEADAMRVNAR